MKWNKATHGRYILVYLDWKYGLIYVLAFGITWTKNLHFEFPMWRNSFDSFWRGLTIRLNLRAAICTKKPQMNIWVQTASFGGSENKARSRSWHLKLQGPKISFLSSSLRELIWFCETWSDHLAEPTWSHFSRKAPNVPFKFQTVKGKGQGKTPSGSPRIICCFPFPQPGNHLWEMELHFPIKPG